MTNAEARCNKSLRPRKPEGSLGRTAQDVHLDSHTAPELWTRRAQRTTFNTLDNWGHKTPTQSEKDKKERLKGHSPKHIQYTRLHTTRLYLQMSAVNITARTSFDNRIQPARIAAGGIYLPSIYLDPAWGAGIAQWLEHRTRD